MKFIGVERVGIGAFRRVFTHCPEPLKGDDEGEFGLRMGAKGGANTVEFSVKGFEQIGEIDGGEALGQLLHRFFMKRFSLGLVEEAAMMAAEVLALEGDLTAVLAGGKRKTAEFGCYGHGLAPL